VGRFGRSFALRERRAGNFQVSLRSGQGDWRIGAGMARADAVERGDHRTPLNKDALIMLNLQLFPDLPIAVQIHIIAALSALVLGIIMYARRKGTRSHKMIGKLFLAFMLLTATSAIFIRYLNDGSFSWIHIFVPLTFLGAWEAVHHIRKGNIKGHKRAVTGMFYGALLIPGFLSFLPGRTMWMMVFGG
jgi:uncharacterized membrane protein